MTNKPPFRGERVRLGDVCQVVSGATPKTGNESFWGGDIKWITPAEIDENAHVITQTAKSLTPEGFASASLRMLPAGTVLLTTRAPIGKVAIAGVPMCCNQGFKNLVCSDVIYNEYLYRLLKFNSGALQAMGRGATFKELSKRNVESFVIKLPNYEWQRRIVGNLLPIESLIAAAKRRLSLFDDLVKSRFVEMFGDCRTYPISPLGKCVVSIDTGSSPKCAALARKDCEPAVLKLSAITSGVYREGENKRLFEGAAIDPRREVTVGDILIARKNTPELVGTCAYVRSTRGNIMFPDLVFRMQPARSCNGVYLACLLSGTLANEIKSLAHGSAKSMSNIPKTGLARLPIPLPPLALQQEFADFVAEADKSRLLVQKQIGKLQTLYDSLAQDYFG